MKAIILRGPEQVTYEEVPVPDPGPGDVLLKIESALTCGTDLKVFMRGGHPRMIKTPAIFGHEMAGTVEKAGSGVRGFEPGDGVVPANSAPCGECPYCGKGMPNLCDDMLYINGAFAEYVVIPQRIVEKNLHRIPDGLSFREAAMAEPLACAMHGAAAADVSAGDTVLVCGAGPLGLMFVSVLGAAGATVICAEPVEERRDAARQLGAEQIVSSLDDTDLSAQGVDAAIDATGLPGVWQQCVSSLRKGGTAVLFGGAKPGTTVTFDTKKLHYDHITVKGVYHHTPEYMRAAVAFLCEHGDMVDTIVTTTVPLAETESALRMMADRKALKVEIRT